MSSLTIHTDGGSRGNPGPAAIGVVIKRQDNRLLHQFAQTIGVATNNVAEYQGVIFALNYLITSSQKTDQINFFLDSTLVVNQLNGLWKVKNSNLRSLVIKIRRLEESLKVPVSYTAIPRQQNFEPDALLNQALDSQA